MRLSACFALFLSLVFPLSAADHDLVLYGGTPAGLTAAIAAHRENPELKIMIVEPGPWIGGVVTGGLSRTDKGREDTIGGITREYFQRAGELGGEETPMWYAEPKHNMAAFEAMLEECGDNLQLMRQRRIKSVGKEGNRIVEITLDDDSVLRGKIFIDASYEGDLMARAGVSYVVGRESRETYDEPLAGYYPMKVRPHGPETMGAVCSCLGGDAPHFIHGTPTDIDAFDGDGNLIAGVTQPDPKAEPGSADHLTQAYNFRLCVTQRKDILIPFPNRRTTIPRAMNSC